MALQDVLYTLVENSTLNPAEKAALHEDVANLGTEEVLEAEAPVKAAPAETVSKEDEIAQLKARLAELESPDGTA